MSPRFDLNYLGDLSAWRVHNVVDYLQIDAFSFFKHQIDAIEVGLDYLQTLFVSNYLKGRDLLVWRVHDVIDFLRFLFLNIKWMHFYVQTKLGCGRYTHMHCPLDLLRPSKLFLCSNWRRSRLQCQVNKPPHLKIETVNYKKQKKLLTFQEVDLFVYIHVYPFNQTQSCLSALQTNTIISHLCLSFTEN